jgi:hypothetical protein
MTNRYDYLNAQHIIRMYNKEHENINMISRDPAPYVELEGTALRFNYLTSKYFRDAGVWSVGYKYGEYGTLIADCESMPDLHGKKLKKISFEDWYEQNEEYLNDE